MKSHSLVRARERQVLFFFSQVATGWFEGAVLGNEADFAPLARSTLCAYTFHNCRNNTLRKVELRHGLARRRRLRMRPPLTRKCDWQWYNNTLSAFTCLSTYMCRHERGDTFLQPSISSVVFQSRSREDINMNSSDSGFYKIGGVRGDHTPSSVCRLLPLSLIVSVLSLWRDAAIRAHPIIELKDDAIGLGLRVRVRDGLMHLGVLDRMD